MKRYILFFFTTIAVLSIDAVRTNVGGLNYTLIKESHEAIINYGNKCIGELDIPSEVNYNGETFVVKSMIWKAFYDSPELTKVRIPKTLESVMHYYPNDPDEGDIETILVSSDVMNPFSKCYSLESIEVDEENPSMKSVDGVLISKDGTRLYCYPIGKQQEAYSIPEDVEWIGANAFEGSHNLTTLTIPNNITHICSCAFQNCNNLTDLYCYAENVPTTGVNVFNESPIASATLHVPAGSLEAYKAKAPWKDFGTIVGIPEEYYPEGTKWTEIRLDTLKYNSWYSKVGEDWVPNFETIEYRVQGECTAWDEVLKKVYSNGPEWTDSLAFLLLESRQNVEMTVIADGYALLPGVAYQFNWSVGKGIYYRDILESNSTGEYPIYLFFGVINEIKEGDFGGVRPLKYVDLDGKAPDNTYEYWDWGFTDARGGRIIQGIGITEWNDGECLFGPPDPYYAGYGWRGDYKSRHYRSMLVHFERNNEVLYDVWPKKEIPSSITVKDAQSANQGALFDLQGRKLQGKPSRGIYIENGQKKAVGRDN